MTDESTLNVLSNDSTFVDPLVEYYKKDIDRSLLRENLMLTPAQRAAKYESFLKYARELYESGLKARQRT